MKQLERGFTLIELLVTISVIAILSAVALPSFQSMMETRRLIAATEGVYAHLQFARSEAVKFGLAANLNVSVKTGTPWCLGISNSVASCNCTIPRTSSTLADNSVCTYGTDGDGDTYLDMTRNLSGDEFRNVALTTNQANAQVDGIRGGFGGTAGTITLTSSPSGLTTNIVFSRFGRVKICSASGVGGYPSCS